MAVEGLKAALSLTGQIVTLSSGLIGLTVTFVKEFRPPGAGPLAAPGILQLSWLAFALSVCFGIWTQMAITGTLNQVDSGSTETNPSRSNIRTPAALMLLAFAVGVGLTVAAGVTIVR